MANRNEGRCHPQSPSVCPGTGGLSPKKWVFNDGWAPAQALRTAVLQWSRCDPRQLRMAKTGTMSMPVGHTQQQTRQFKDLPQPSQRSSNKPGTWWLGILPHALQCKLPRLVIRIVWAYQNCKPDASIPVHGIVTCARLDSCNQHLNRSKVLLLTQAMSLRLPGGHTNVMQPSFLLWQSYSMTF